MSDAPTEPSFITDMKAEMAERMKRERQAYEASPAYQAYLASDAYKHRKMHDALMQAFESMTVGKQALWEPVKVAVAAAVLNGDVARAIEIITTLPAIYPGADTERQQFLDLFAALSQAGA